MNLNDLKSKARKMLGQNSDKINQSIDKAGEAAKTQFKGKSEQIDKATGKAKTFVDEQSDKDSGSPRGSGDSDDEQPPSGGPQQPPR